MRKPSFDAGGGQCSLCKTRLPEWDCRDICDACLGECYEADHRDDYDHEEADDGRDE